MLKPNLLLRSAIALVILAGISTAFSGETVKPSYEPALKEIGIGTLGPANNYTCGFSGADCLPELKPCCSCLCHSERGHAQNNYFCTDPATVNCDEKNNTPCWFEIDDVAVEGRREMCQKI